MSPWTVYFILILDSVKLTAGLVGSLLGVGFVIAIIIWCAASCECTKPRADKEDYFIRRISKIFTWIFGPIAAICLLFATFLPNTKQAVAIWVVPKVVNNEHVQDISENSMKLLDERLEGWVEKIKEDQEKEN